MANLVRKLRKKNIELVDHASMLFRCKVCRHEWIPEIERGGRLPVGYWKCPNGCNVEKPQGTRLFD